MAPSGWLIDTSALVRIAVAADADEWADRVERGLVRVCVLTRLEVGYSARSGQDFRALMTSAPLARLLTEYTTPAIEDRAAAVQLTLADRGQHRAPSIADLIVAATAEMNALTVLHVDKDFDLIAEVTGQPVERLRIA